ncbi:MAG: phosphatidate cytidylyltransferase [Thioalkalispiraceae bacterium]|jgi:phosphatidate cytidylyltransferase
MLKQRILTALILIPLVLWAIIDLPDNYYAVVLAFIVILGAREWTSMARLNKTMSIVYLLVFVAILYVCWFKVLTAEQYSSYLLYVACAWWLLAFYLLAKFNRGQTNIVANRFLRAIIGILILLPTFAALYLLRTQLESGASLVIYLLVLIWLADSAAYFSGKRWGKNKLLPNVSPGKTWQGVYGALVASISFSIIFALLNSSISNAQTPVFVLISFITVIFSVHGDLTESMFKRQVNIKDSGQLLPGHGGMLDRIDSLTAAAPVFMTGLYLMRGGL